MFRSHERSRRYAIRTVLDFCLYHKRWLSAGLIAFGILPAILLYPFNADNDVWQWAGTVFVRYGGLPYLDAWDNAFPAVTLFHALAIATLGESMLAFRTVEYIAILCTILALYKTSRLWLSPAESCFGCIVFALFYAYGRLDCMGQRDSFAIFAILLTAYFFIRAFRKTEIKEKYWLLFAGGAMAGFATCFRPTYAVLIAVPFFTLFRITDLRAIALAGLGFFIPIFLLLLSYALRTDGLYNLYCAAIRYNSDIYSHIPPSAARFKEYLHNLLELRTLVLFILGTAWILYHSFRKIKGNAPVIDSNRERRFLYILFGSLWVGMFMQQALAAVHFSAFYAGFIPVLSKSFWDAIQPFQQWRRTALMALLFLLAALLYPWGLVRSFIAGGSLESAYRCYSFADSAASEDAAIAGFLDRHTDRSDYVEIMGDPGISWRTHRRKSNRFQAPWQFVFTSYTGKTMDYQNEWRREFFASLQTTLPRYIVFSRDLGGQPQFFYSACLPYTPEIKDFIEQHYIFDTIFPMHAIYKEVGRTR